ncbi:TlpA family protein disulfide reductase [Candidatus Pelagibacter sp.]|nr:TlpA family protein disulfide reductase [Candidatus Pelagibacter sp.]
MRFIIIFIFFFSNAIAGEVSNLKNIVINEKLKRYDDLTFLDADNNQISLKNYKGNLILLNFWATWCSPCKEEMPSLNNLQKKKDLNNLKIFPINIGKDNLEKSLNFFENLDIKDLKIYFDSPISLAKKLQLRGIPTSILINKDGFEFARIIGSIDFENENFIKWLSGYN